MTLQQKVELWDAVNSYAQACGGDTKTTNPARERAVVQVERIVYKIAKLPDSIQWALNSGDGTYKP
jgi:hypothetical protein